MKIEEIIKKSFSSSLGKQCDSLFSTSNKKVFIRQEEAIIESEKLEDETIFEWYEEFEGKNLEPKYHKIKVKGIVQ